VIKILAIIGDAEQTFDFEGTPNELLSRLSSLGITVHLTGETKFFDTLSLVMPPDSSVGHHLNSAGTAVVSDDVYWKPIDANTPRGASMWLINRAAGVSQKGKYNPDDNFYTHWFPNPKFKKEEI